MIALAVVVVITGGTMIHSALAQGDVDELEVMLIEALENEYEAKATYDILLNLHGENQVLENIKAGEVNHIETIQRLFVRYGYVIPENNKVNELNITANDDATALGIAHEKRSIALYERLLKNDLPQDVERVFENMLRGSKNHLQALEQGECDYREQFNRNRRDAYRQGERNFNREQGGERLGSHFRQNLERVREDCPVDGTGRRNERDGRNRRQR